MKRTPLKAKSAKQRASDRELAKAKAVVRLRSGGRCEVRSEVCVGRAHDPHHVERQAQTDGHDPEKMLDACRPCHDFIHGPGLTIRDGDTVLSYSRGWLVHIGADL